MNLGLDIRKDGLIKTPSTFSFLGLAVCVGHTVKGSFLP